jgi:hypothetical protein
MSDVPRFVVWSRSRAAGLVGSGMRRVDRQLKGWNSGVAASTLGRECSGKSIAPRKLPDFDSWDC